MANIEIEMPDGNIGVFREDMSREDINAIIERDFPDYRVLPNNKYGKFRPDQTDEDRDNLIRKDFPSYPGKNLKAQAEDEGQLQALTNSLLANWGSESYGTMMAVIETMTGDAPDFNSAYDKYRKEFDDKAKLYAKNNPGKALAMDVTGAAVTLPLTMLRGASAIKYLPSIWKSLPNTVKATVASAISGGVFGLGEDENRIESGKSGFLWGGIGGGVFNKLFVSPIQKLRLKRARNNPTLDDYKALEQDLYNKMDKDLGKSFQSQDLWAIKSLAETKLAQPNINYDPKLDKYTASKLKDLEKIMQRGDEFTISEIRDIRKSIWKRWEETKEDGLIQIIEALDEVVQTKPLQHALATEARNATKLTRRMESLEIGLAKAKEKGGDTEKHFKEAIRYILNSPKVRQNWEANQIAAMENFVNSKHSKFWNKQLAKMSPDSNSLVKFLHFFSFAHDPRYIALTGASIAAKKSQEKTLQEATDIIRSTIDPLNFMRPSRPSSIPATMLGTAAGVAGAEGELQGLQDYVWTPIP